MDIKSLKKVEEPEGDGTRKRHYSSIQNSSDLEGHPNLGTTSTIKPTSTKPIQIANLKITSGAENGEIMRNYRETIEAYIREYLIHQPWAKQICSAEVLTDNIKKVFQGVVSRLTEDGSFL
jgi:hypothetical protein